jgi:transposase InsO family protein
MARIRAGCPAARCATDRGPEFSGRRDEHSYQPFLVVNNIDHTKSRVKNRQPNGICERFPGKRPDASSEQLQQDLDLLLTIFNEQHTHQGSVCCGRTPRETFDSGMPI